MFASVAIDARGKRWHSKAIHRALEAQRGRLGAEALERIKALDLTVTAANGPPWVEVAGDRVLIHVDCSGWTSLAQGSVEAGAAVSRAMAALLAHFGLRPWPTDPVRVRASPLRVATTEVEARREAIRRRAADSLGRPTLLIFDAYRTDPDGLPIDNLDEIAFAGTCQFEASGDGEPDYRSRVFTSPTWLEIVAVADEQLRARNEQQTVWLEGVSPLRQDGDITVLRLLVGS